MVHNEMNKNSNDMKEQLTIISDDLNHGIITEKEVRTKLLILFGISVSLPSRQEMDRQVVDIMVDTLQIGTGQTEGILMNKLETSYKILNYIEKITGNEH